MITAYSYTATTSFFLGACRPCSRPTRVTLDVDGRFGFTACPECGAPVKVERLHAVVTTDVCDARCMGAVGPNCSCACGGANHGGNYTTHTSYETESAVEAYRARQAKVEAQRQAKAERERRARVAVFDAWAEGNQDVIDFLREDRAYVSEFLDELEAKVREYAMLSERQVAAVRRNVERRNLRARRDAEFAASKRTAPSGKAVVIEGDIVKTNVTETAYGRKYTMLVLADGFKVHSSIPAALQGVTTAGNLWGLNGKRVRFVADLAVSERDDSFAFAKRPRNAEVVAVATAA